MSELPVAPEQIIHVVDDDEALRDSMTWMLEGNGYRVLTYESAEAFLRVCRPDMAGCVVLDVRMPGMSGLEMFEELGRRRCTLPVVFITGHGDVPMAVSALKKGAVDFIEKPFSERDMLRLIEQCLMLERDSRDKRLQEADTARRLEHLTQREREVLDLIIVGKLNKQIADVLGISIKTVEVHRARVMEKMGANSLAELVQHVVTVEPGALLR
ncbi:response regulator transcription factor [Thauera linaloolentis]|uniref:LuxR family transcriptional regulator n=1 Tax=Thauera linaloolentis (strain DSM 12138 / JCM 21573 / CCUG 41526 / CIP 105981 / IAM 15112 / NBRC 102519 / 47Lol) TaxID=1123367 RepID=N6YXL7_THAL4|nr:response regulator transcription factor [Thauera linaloolentis]ENO86868.1 LuxR family transcriptional regulator [Thauera linaloolentis 47Lol = DSM 12138]MCM8565293.1 response regulator transcription factor [Thauera linaloolentis]